MYSFICVCVCVQELYHDFSLLLPREVNEGGSIVADTELPVTRLEDLLRVYFSPDTRDLACDRCLNANAQVEVRVSSSLSSSSLLFLMS